MRLAIAFLASAVATAAAAAAPPDATPRSPLVCPARISVRQNQVVDAGDWTVGIMPGHRRPRAGDHVLSNISIAEGPPEQQGLLAPDDSRTTDGRLVNRWSLAASKLGYWLICEYDTSGANLNRRLGPDIGQCVIRYGPDGHVLAGDEAVSCGPARAGG